MTLPSPAAAPPIVLPVALVWIVMPPFVFPTAAPPAAFDTDVVAPHHVAGRGRARMRMPTLLLPEITFRAPAVAPPTMVPDTPFRLMPSPVFPRSRCRPRRGRSGSPG